eukprot:1968153-Rhodomonas_salina.3
MSGSRCCMLSRPELDRGTWVVGGADDSQVISFLQPPPSSTHHIEATTNQSPGTQASRLEYVTRRNFAPAPPLLAEAPSFRPSPSLSVLNPRFPGP